MHIQLLASQTSLQYEFPWFLGRSWIQDYSRQEDHRGTQVWEYTKQTQNRGLDILAREETPGEGGGEEGNSRAGRDEYARVIFFLPRPLPVISAHLCFLRLVAL